MSQSALPLQRVTRRKPQPASRFRVHVDLSPAATLKLFGAMLAGILTILFILSKGLGI